MKRNSAIPKDVRQAKTRMNILSLGIFFLIWSINGFFIGGNTIKMTLLISGFLLIVFTAFHFRRDILFMRFVFFTFLMLLSYWLIAYIKDQTTIRSSVVIFDVICYLLLLSGFLLARNVRYFDLVNSKVILLLAALTILGVVMYARFQSVLQASTTQISSRAVVEEGDESGVNAIGIAYANAIIFLILYHFLSYYKLKRWLKAILLISMLSTFFLIFSTQSRGALIYILLILLLDNIYKFRSFKSIFKILFSLSLMIVVSLIIYFQAVQSFPVLETKIGAAFDRFEKLQKVTSNVQADESSYERAQFAGKFYDDIGNIIMFGQEKYKPYPHNQIIEILMRWGIFFGMPLLLFSLLTFLKSMRIVVKNVNVNPLINMMVLLFIFSFLQSLSSMSLEMNRMLWLGLGFLAGMPALSKLIITKQKVKQHEYA